VLQHLDLSDDQIMRSIVRRDETALELLYDRFASAVMGLALKMLGSRPAAEEIVQETFWRVWNKADTYQSDRGSVLSWIFGIAHNLCVDYLRRIRADEMSVEVGNLINQPDPGVNVFESASLSMQGQQVRAALEELPPEQREVIELAYFAGLTRQEISQKTGVPLGTVHTRARLGLQKLHAALLAGGIERDAHDG